METETPDIWEMLDSPPDGCEAVAGLFYWSTNFENGEGPATLFLDMIGWSEDRYGETLYDLKAARLGYVELDKLGLALREYADRPHDVKVYVDALMETW